MYYKFISKRVSFYLFCIIWYLEGSCWLHVLLVQFSSLSRGLVPFLQAGAVFSCPHAVHASSAADVTHRGILHSQRPLSPPPLRTLSPETLSSLSCCPYPVNVPDQGYWKSQFPENKTFFSKVILGFLFETASRTNVGKHSFLHLLEVGLSWGQISLRNPCMLYLHLKIHTYISVVKTLQLR